MSRNALNVQSDAFKLLGKQDALRARLQRVIDKVDSREDRTTPYEFAKRTKLIAIYGRFGFLRGRQGEQLLDDIEDLFAATECVAAPIARAAQMMQLRRLAPRCVCAARYFIAIAIPGGGDVILDFRSDTLLARVNSHIALQWAHLKITTRRSVQIGSTSVDLTPRADRCEALDG